MRRRLAPLIVLALACNPTLAQDPAELQAAYDDALRQLQAAQNARNDLASEIERLVQELATTRAEAEALRARAGSLQSLYSSQIVLEQFLAYYPAIAPLYLEFASVAMPIHAPSWRMIQDASWPFSAIP